MNAEPQHVIFGTGAIGLATLDALRRPVIGTRPPNAPGRARLPLVTRFLPAPREAPAGR
jgi:hypothetical protein